MHEQGWGIDQQTKNEICLLKWIIRPKHLKRPTVWSQGIRADGWQREQYIVLGYFRGDTFTDLFTSVCPSIWEEYNIRHRELLDEWVA